MENNTFNLTSNTFNYNYLSGVIVNYNDAINYGREFVGFCDELITKYEMIPFYIPFNSKNYRERDNSLEQCIILASKDIEYNPRWIVLKDDMIWQVLFVFLYS